MYLSKRNGIYYLYYKQINNKITCISTKTKKKSEALKFLSQFEKKKRDQPYSSFTFRYLVFQFLVHAESVYSQNHWKSLKTTFNQSYSYFGEDTVGKLTTERLQKYFNIRAARVSTHAVKRDIANFSSFFSWCLSQGYQSNNPIKLVKKPKLPEKQPLYFTKEELNKLILSIDNDVYKDLIILAVNTGLRQMELLSLTSKQIDLERGILTLDNRNHITKSKRIRVIPMNSHVINIMKKRINSENIFLFSQNQTVKLFQKYRKKSNIRSELTFHSLRHTFASWLVQKGVSIYHVSKLLGHASVKTTEIYSHLNNSDLKASVELLE